MSVAPRRQTSAPLCPASWLLSCQQREDRLKLTSTLLSCHLGAPVLSGTLLLFSTQRQAHACALSLGTSVAPLFEMRHVLLSLFSETLGVGGNAIWHLCALQNTRHLRRLWEPSGNSRIRNWLLQRAPALHALFVAVPSLFPTVTPFLGC